MATHSGNWVDFKEVRARVSIEEVIDLLGISTLTRAGDAFVGPCPIHGGTNPRAFRADTKKNVWFCFSQCRKGGNQLDLVAAVRDISIREAALLLQRHFLSGTAPPRTTGNGPPPQPPRPPAPPDIGVHTPSDPEARVEREKPAPASPPTNPVITVELALRADHPHLVERGLSEETARAFGVGYCSRGIMRGTIAIPVHNADGGLVAYAGRRLAASEVREFGKYKLPKGFHKDSELYNWHRARATVGSAGYVILVEGFFTTMLLTERGLPHTVATMGASISAAQADRLATAPEVIVLFDGDEAGRAGARRARDQLAERTLVRIIHLPTGLEPETLPHEMLDWLIAGARAFDLGEVAITVRGLEDEDVPDDEELPR